MDHWKKIERYISKLANKALKDKLFWAPPKGSIFLEDVKIGNLVQVHESKMKGILLGKTPSSATVYCTKNGENADPFYLGEHK